MTYIDEVHKNVKYKCELCGIAFTRNRSKRNHITNVHNNKSKDLAFRCESCNKVFKQKSVLKRHFANLHAMEKDFKCSLCEATFAQESDLRDHLKFHSLIRLKRDKCPSDIATNKQVNINDHKM